MHLEMKTLCVPLLLTVFLGSVLVTLKGQAPTPAPTTKVRLGGGSVKPALAIKLFEAVRDQEASAGLELQSLDFVVVGHLEGSIYLVRPFWFSKGRSGEFPTSALDLRGEDPKLVDGAQLKNVRVSRAGRHDYTSIDGAKRRVTKYQRFILDPTKQLTRDTFVRRLKSGEEIAVVLTETARCQRCRGFGKVSSPGGRGNLGKVDCRDCHGRGQLSEARRYLIRW